MNQIRRLPWFLGCVGVVAACWTIAGRAAVSATPTLGLEGSGDSSTPSSSLADETLTAGTMADQILADLPAWQTMAIIDVQGETFTLAEYIGTPVLVETFATWCSKCRAQLGDTQEAAAALGDEAAVVALSVETSLSPETVAEYAADNEFTDIRFAVMSPELLAGFADAFGTTVANPPSTPKFIIDAMGDAGELTTGSESVEDIVANLQAAGPPSTPAASDGTAGTTDS